MTAILGLLLLIVAAICYGGFSVPYKLADKNLSWEILWAPFFLFATFILPLLFAPILIPEILHVYVCGNVSLFGVLMPLFLGSCWGLGFALFAWSISQNGISLTYSLNYAGQIIFGAALPMLFVSKFVAGSLFQGLQVIAICAGIVASFAIGRAGVLKVSDGPNFLNRRLGFAVLSGGIGVFWLFAIVFGAEIFGAVEEMDITLWRSAFPVAFLVLWGGALSTIPFFIWLFHWNKSWNQFLTAKGGLAALIGVLIAILHFAAVVLFLAGASCLGSIEFAIILFAVFSLLSGNAIGYATGEWQNTDKRTKQWLAVGIGILVVSIFFVSGAYLS